jgi:hypothetical protein
MLGKTPGLTAIVVLTLALGDWRQYCHIQCAERVATSSSASASAGATRSPKFFPTERKFQFSFSDFVDFRKEAASFCDLFGYGLAVGGLSADGKAVEFAYSAVMGDYFSTLGVKPILGRVFLPGEGERPGGDLLVVVGYSYWQRQFGGDPGSVGKQVLVNGKPATIIGITAVQFHGTFFSFDTDGYLLLRMWE